MKRKFKITLSFEEALQVSLTPKLETMKQPKEKPISFQVTMEIVLTVKDDMTDADIVKTILKSLRSTAANVKADPKKFLERSGFYGSWRKRSELKVQDGTVIPFATAGGLDGKAIADEARHIKPDVGLGHKLPERPRKTNFKPDVHE
jgi:hypothetical protein